ncbi:MAG: S49 family peptidase [Phycisphaeraceae bacterium]
MSTRLLRLVLAVLLIAMLPSVAAFAQADAPNAVPQVVEPEEKGETVGWLVLQGGLREGPIREAWIAEEDAAPSLRSVIKQIETVRDGKHYLGLVVYLDMPMLSATQTDAIYKALLELRETGKTVITFAQAYSTADYVLASAGDVIALQNKGMVELSGMHMEEMYLAGLMEKVGVQPNFIQVGKFKGAAEQMTRKGPSESWSKNMDGLLDGLYATMTQRIAEGRGVNVKKVEAMMEQSWTLDDRGLLKAGIVDRLCGRDLVEVTETEFGDEFVWDTEMGQTTSSPMGAAVAANPMMMIAALMQDPITTTNGPTIMVIHASGAIISGDSEFGGGGFGGGGSSIGSRTIDEMLSDALADDNVKGVVLRLDSPGGSALASEVMWQAIRAFGEEKPIVCSVGGMAASGGYYIASACDEILIEPRSIVGSIGVVAGKMNLKGLYDKVGVGIHTRSRGPNASLLSSVDNFTEAEKQKLTASMELVYDLFRDRVATGRGTRLKDLDAVDEGMLFTGTQAVKSGMADQLGSVEDAIALVAKKAELEDDAYAVMELPHPVSLATYLEGMLGGGGLPLGLSAPEHSATLMAAKELVGPQAWQQITRALHGITLLRDEQVLLLMPQPIIVK